MGHPHRLRHAGNGSSARPNAEVRCRDTGGLSDVELSDRVSKRTKNMTRTLGKDKPNKTPSQESVHSENCRGAMGSQYGDGSAQVIVRAEDAVGLWRAGAREGYRRLM